MIAWQLASLVGLLLATVDVGGLQEEDAILVLTDHIFEATVRSNQFILVEFYAPWCGHCRQFAPVYAAAAKRLRANSPSIPLAKVDATSETRLAEQYGVRGYPTLRLFVDGKDEEYTGGRTEKSLVAWVLKKTVQPFVWLQDIAAAERFENDAEFAFIGTFASGVPSAFSEVARRTNDVAFACSTSRDVLRRYGMEAPSAKMLFPHDDKEATFSGNLLIAPDIENFIKTYRHPRVSTFSGEISAQIFGDGRPIMFLFYDQNDEGRAAERELAVVASNLNRRLLISVAGSSVPMDQRLMDFLGVEPEELPTVRIITSPTKQMLKYKYSGVLDAASLTQFAIDFEAGRLMPHFKSEDPPSTQTGPVLTVVGSTFDSVVRHSESDVLVEFFAPWCGHCKKFEAVYKEVARRLEPVRTLQIAKIDATSNDVEGIVVEDFPTIKLFRSGLKEIPLDYDGDRDVSSVLSWLEEKVSHRFSRNQLRSEL